MTNINKCKSLNLVKVEVKVLTLLSSFDGTTGLLLASSSTLLFLLLGRTRHGGVAMRKEAL